MLQPLITIVTVVYNDKCNIALTIESVIKLKTEKLEYIVIDGASDDGTLEIIKRYETGIDQVLSEKDTGIYNAMNKGINLAKGEFVLNINCGDLLLIDPVSLLEKIDNLSRYDILIADVKLSDREVFKSQISFLSKARNTIHHQGALYKLSSMRYNEEYKVFSDFDYNLRLINKAGFCFYKIGETLSFHSTGGASHNRTFYSETYAIIARNSGFFYVMIAFLYNKCKGLQHRLLKLARWKNS